MSNQRRNEHNNDVLTLDERKAAIHETQHKLHLLETELRVGGYSVNDDYEVNRVDAPFTPNEGLKKRISRYTELRNKVKELGSTIKRLKQHPGVLATYPRFGEVTEHELWLRYGINPETGYKQHKVRRVFPSMNYEHFGRHYTVTFNRIYCGDSEGNSIIVYFGYLTEEDELHEQILVGTP